MVRHVETVEELEEAIGGRPFSMTHITPRGWLSVELVVQDWQGQRGYRLFLTMAWLLCRAVLAFARSH